MKYIRTKEHVYKRLFIDKAIINECGCGVCDKDLNPIGETIIKESENLEELCDEFVIADVEHKCWERVFKPALEQVLKDYKKPYAIYGAIWTSKGLIYVAKMNDKGELELL